jgi:hypothetical protein
LRLSARCSIIKRFPLSFLHMKLHKANMKFSKFVVDIQEKSCYKDHENKFLPLITNVMLRGWESVNYPGLSVQDRYPADPRLPSVRAAGR